MLVIKGAFYYNSENNCICQVHHTGDFYVADCDMYKTAKDIKENYSDWRTMVRENLFVTYNGKKYFDTCNYSPQNVSDLDLLSDLSDLVCNNDNLNF